MSRIGKQIIAVPSGVALRQEGTTLTIEGPKGKLKYDLQPEVAVQTEGGVAKIARKDDSRRGRAIHGLTRKLVANMVQGVSAGFSRNLEITGVGYRAEVRKEGIYFNLGYSHPILYQLPAEVTAKVEKQTSITLESSDRQLLGRVAAEIRALRPPEPYKGKGIKYSDEVIRRKAGKAAGAAGS